MAFLIIHSKLTKCSWGETKALMGVSSTLATFMFGWFLQYLNENRFKY